MTRILFVCLGNICRSPMAEFVLKDLAEKAGKSLYAESAGTCDIEVGRPVYPPAREVLESNGLCCEGKVARQITPEDYDRFDLLIAMDEKNVADMKALWGGDPEGKIHLLMEYAHVPGNVADPFFTRNFQITWDDIQTGCRGLLAAI